MLTKFKSKVLQYPKQHLPLYIAETQLPRWVPGFEPESELGNARSVGVKESFSVLDGRDVIDHYDDETVEDLRHRIFGGDTFEDVALGLHDLRKMAEKVDDLIGGGVDGSAGVAHCRKQLEAYTMPPYSEVRTQMKQLLHIEQQAHDLSVEDLKSLAEYTNDPTYHFCIVLAEFIFREQDHFVQNPTLECAIRFDRSRLLAVLIAGALQWHIENKTPLVLQVYNVDGVINLLLVLEVVIPLRMVLGVWLLHNPFYCDEKVRAKEEKMKRNANATANPPGDGVAEMDVDWTAGGAGGAAGGAGASDQVPTSSSSAEEPISKTRFFGILFSCFFFD